MSVVCVKQHTFILKKHSQKIKTICGVCIQDEYVTSEECARLQLRLHTNRMQRWRRLVRDM